MKKFGFTLAEVLISMSIIGIVATITAPTLINIMPNRDKVQTLKYQKLISEINADLLNNRTFYSNGKWDNTKINVPEYTNPAFISSLERSRLSTNKYAYLLMKKLELNTTASYTSKQVKFTTQDGYQWEVNTSNGKPKYIIIDINGTEGPNKYGSASLKYPDRFYFGIDDNGYAQCDSSKDPITCRYMNCPYYMNNRKLDYECIKKYTGKCACS